MRVPVLRSTGLVAGSVLLGVIGTGPAGAVPGPASAHAPRGAAAHQHESRQVGRWTVAPHGAGQYRLTWHSPTRIPTTDAPVQVRHRGTLATAGVSADSRTVSLVVASSTPPDPSTYDVVLGARVLDRRGGGTPFAGTDRTPYRAPSTRELLTDPGEPGTHAITSSNYQLDPVALPGISKLSEMVGHVVAPTDATGASPLVLFLHGRHEPCYRPHGGKAPSPPTDPSVWACPEGDKPIPSYLGYDYVQRLLASQGYVTVSISADAINALDFRDEDGGAAARATLIRDHLRAWVGFVDDGTHPADLSDVVLVGHSRGGEGVNRASLDLPRDEGYQVSGQVLIGPTDFAFQAAPSTPTVTLLPYCDGDVSDLQGQNFTDDGRDITADPTADLAFHSSVLIMGADHNFFNSEWTPGISVAPSFDDWGGTGRGTCGSKNPARLSAGQQRSVGAAYIAGAVHLFADGDESVLPMFDGSPVSVPSAGNADVRSHAIGGGIVTVRPGLDGTASDGATAQVRLCEGISDSDEDTACQKTLSSVRAPHWPSTFFPGVPHRQFLDVGWTSSGQQGGLDLDQPWDLSAVSRLDLRTIVDPRRGPVHVGVTLTDAADHTTVLNPVGGGNLDPLPGGSYSLAKRWGQDLRVSLSGVSDVDLSQITQVGLVSRNTSGRVYVADVSATPDAGVSADPTAPTPVFSIDTVKQPEGDGTDRVTVDVPWHVTGDLDHQAVLTILHGTPFGGGSEKPRTLVVPAHTDSGVLHVKYRPNDLDDRGKRLIGVTAYAVSGIETDQYIGGAQIVDDDPTPGLTLRTEARRITAGKRATWTLALDAPVNYFAFAIVKPVKAVDGPQLRVGDLTKKFRQRYFGGEDVDLAMPLYKSPIRFFVQIPPPRTSGSISIPTRQEGGVTRAISLKFRVPHFDLTNPVRTVRVKPSR